MSPEENTKEKNELETNQTPTSPEVSKEAVTPAKKIFRGTRKNFRRTGSRVERAKPEFDQKVLSMRRVTRVVAGGRRFSFSVALVAGNRKGSVGVGVGKAVDTALAIDKAFRDARKNMRVLPTGRDMSLPHDTQAKYASSVVKVMPAPGRGIIAGGAVRVVLEYAGLKNVSAKVLSRSKNALNNAKATIKALEAVHPRR